MKKFLKGLLVCLMFIPLVVSAKEKVKVYIFEAGGCPYCEREIEYLKGLDSYNKKFTIEQKELYVDHVMWQPGEDYLTGVKTVNAFLNYDSETFADASFQGTPFVVISDLYAAAAYSTSLEDIIDKAYDKGDKDVVNCIEKGKDNCLKGYNDAEESKKAEAEYESAMASYNYRLQQSENGSTENNTYNTNSNSSANISSNAILIFILAIVVIFTIIIVINSVLSKKALKETEKETTKRK